ncbi:MAG: HAD family hydrolase [Clostridia bacterium]|nr:HAD family hydrolase [Clostridia bacterium]
MDRIDLVIWDWNGTLLDDTELCWRIAEEMRASRGMTPIGSIDGYRKLFRFPVEAYYRDMGYTFETESFQDITDEFLSAYSARQTGCPLMEGAVETLSALGSMGISQAVLSATGEERLLREISRYGVAGYFTAIAGQKDELAVSKAARGLELMATLGTDAAHTMFVGDTDHDLEVANAIGCRCVLIPNGCQHPDKLGQLGCPVLNDISEVPAYVAEPKTE